MLSGPPQRTYQSAQRMLLIYPHRVKGELVYIRKQNIPQGLKANEWSLD